jgi:hypothetical protein
MSEALHVLFGRRFGEDELVAVFSLRLDETGTDGLSPITVVAGAVATKDQWDKLEDRWQAIMSRNGVDNFHAKEFNGRLAPFNDWSHLKRSRFVDALQRTVARNTTFRASVGIEHAVHKEIKARWKGISGFNADSDYGLCLRYLMFSTSEELLKIDAHHQLTVMVEDGPWSEGAYATYRRVSAMQGKWKPAKHAHRLAGFAAVPFGERPSLEAADFICDQEHARMKAGLRRSQGDTLSVVLTRDILEQWHAGMMKEKETRRAYGARKPKSGASEE